MQYFHILNSLINHSSQIHFIQKIIIMLFSHTLLAIFLAMPGGTEWIFILLAVVLLFGGKKIPELMKGIGKGVRDFNDAKASVKNDIEESMKHKTVAEIANRGNNSI
jgi:sec-independent protein translocase protein TatA